jgi:predicted nucleic acid-binding protein
MPSIPSEALLDVNVIIASVFADHVMHLPARRFLESLDRFYTTPTVQGGFLRFATRPMKNERGDQQQPRLKMSDALATLREFTEAEGHVFVSDDVPFTDLGLRSMQGHRQWTDAYLLHVARKNGLVLASLESRMATLDDPATPALFVVESQ